MAKKPVCLIIRDGWGRGNGSSNDAIFQAKTPYTDEYEKNFPTTLISTDGYAVGLPKGTFGNSEVGHITIGSGRIVNQSLTRIDRAIEDGIFYTNDVFIKAIETAKERNSTIHIMGLIQTAGVHATVPHAVALLETCKRNNFTNVLIHGISDGRDTPPKSAKTYFDMLDEGIKETGIGRVATVVGRYYAMDRDTNWERTKVSYDAIMNGVGTQVSSVDEAIELSYANGETDEFITPKIIDFDGLKDGDVFIFFNYRTDRTRQITKAIVEPDFKEFETSSNKIDFVAFTHYYDNGNFAEAFPLIPMTNLLGGVISDAGLKQVRCAETEKFAHVTFFFNGQENEPYKNETRILVNSPSVATYDLQPEMSAYEVRDKLLEAIATDEYDAYIINFANCDMVGHTGVFDAIVKSAEAVDECSHDVIEAIRAKGGVVLLTADHGNADQTTYEDGSVMTCHTLNKVPFTFIKDGDFELINDGELSDIAPTMLTELGLEVPAEMTGRQLIKGK